MRFIQRKIILPSLPGKCEASITAAEWGEVKKNYAMSKIKFGRKPHRKTEEFRKWKHL
jgi:hypothetical protein